jgi:pantoate--beta-alanine ligase
MRISAAPTMELLRSSADLGLWRARDASTGDRVSRLAFVPTMGALHDGHLALVRHARSIADRVVASVFVNPTQFGPHEDFARYPRQPETDAALLAEAGCDALFLPPVDEIYPPGHATFVEPAGAAMGLEGALRPGHFRGVATVVTQLFGIVRPDVAVFGQKDAQQLAVIRQLVRDLHLPVEIVGHPTVREADGVAMSSRNAYLSADERRAAPVLARALERAARAIAEGERDADVVRRILASTVAGEPGALLDYAEVVDAATFQPVSRLGGAVVLPLAARFGSTRLLDNLALFVGD